MAKTYAGNKKAPYKNSTQVKYADETAHALEELGDPLANFKEIAVKCGLPNKTVEILHRRLQRRWVPVKDRVRQVTQKSLLDGIEQKMAQCLDYRDDVAFASAPRRDLALTFAIMHDKRQLLLGQPTQILTVQERKDLNELLPDIIAEAQRRGVTIDQAPVHAGGEVGVSTQVIANAGARPAKNPLMLKKEADAKKGDLHVGEVVKCEHSEY